MNPNIFYMPDGSIRQYTSVGSYTIVYLTINSEAVSAKAIEQDRSRYIDSDGEDRICMTYLITDNRPYWCDHLEFWVS